MAKPRKPQLSDEEVALIKAMVATGSYKRQEILTYFSRKDRPVNLGRISEIATGKKRTGVAAANRGELDEFLKQSGSKTFEPDKDPMGDDALDVLLSLKSKRPRILKVEESDTVEFKESFNWGGRAKYARTIAGYANHKGGYILFGVNDDGKISGMSNDKFSTLDQSKITQFMNACFQPQIYWKREIRKFGNVSVGILWTGESDRKPVICSKTNDHLKEGEIYFRYIGETRAIGYSELIAILEGRDRQTEQLLATKVSRIAEIGSGNAGVLETNTGMVHGDRGSFIIDESLLDKVRFINEGRFVEHGGDPAIRIVGDAIPFIGDGKTVVQTEKSVITNHDIVRDFIHQRKVNDPRGYIRHIVGDQALVVPIFYYIYMAGLSIAETVKILRDEITTREVHREKLIDRVRSPKDYSIKPGPSTEPYRKKIFVGRSINFSRVDHRVHAVKAILTIPENEIKLEQCLSKLRAALKEFDRDPHKDFLTEIRRAAAHIDAAVYAGKIPET